jgi:hypothetical protein
MTGESKNHLGEDGLETKKGCDCYEPVEKVDHQFIKEATKT